MNNFYKLETFKKIEIFRVVENGKSRKLLNFYFVSKIVKSDENYFLLSENLYFPTLTFPNILRTLTWFKTHFILFFINLKRKKNLKLTRAKNLSFFSFFVSFFLLMHSNLKRLELLTFFLLFISVCILMHVENSMTLCRKATLFRS